MRKIRLNINTRMLVYLLSGATFIYVLSLGAVVLQTVNSTKEDTFSIVEKTAAEKANVIKAEIDADFKAVQTLAYAGSTFTMDNFEQWEPIFLEQQKAVLENNDYYLSVATSFELRFIRPGYTEKYGRRLKGYYRESDVIKPFDAQKEMDGDDFTSNYYNIKSKKLNYISDPEMYSYSGKPEDAVLNTNISVPILKNNEFAGLAGADINMNFFQTITDSIQLYPKSYAFILSHNGVVVAHPIADWVGKNLDEVDSVFENHRKILRSVSDGETFSFYSNDVLNNEEFHYTFVPIHVKGPDVNWSLAIAIPKDVLNEKTRAIAQSGILIAIIGMFFMALIITFIARSISRPIIATTKILKKLSLGQIDRENTLAITTNDELGEMAESVNLLTEGLARTAEFAEAVGHGDLAFKYQTLSDRDILGNALLEMRKNLKDAKEEEQKRKEEERIRRWSADGYSMLNEILRQSNDLRDLSYAILTAIIKYIDATMGAIYVLNDTNKDDTYFEMMTSVAYEREKMLRHKVKLQEGLVGRCAHESLTIHLREIPEDYIKVTSGLGESNPRTLILIPLKVNEQVMGVMELVSFNEFEDYHLEFLEKAGETIASDISTTKINQQTEILLKQSQRQAEELSQQEEEMRQNMEEIQATQESLKESQAKTQMIFDNVVDAIVSIDTRGMIELWNPAAEKLFGYTESEVLGKNVKIIMYGTDANEHDNYIKRYTQTGQRHVLGKPREVMAMHKTGRKFPVELLLEEGRLGNETKFVAVLRDVEDKHKLENSMQKRIKQLEEVSKEAQRSKTEMELLINGVKEVSLYVEYNIERKITDINQNFLKLIGKEYEEMLGVEQGVFESEPEKRKEFDKMWADLKTGKTRKMVQKVLANGKTLYFSEVYIPVKDVNNRVVKVINLAIDITDSIRKHK
ncbi:MAG: PAS domain S-box protein [Salinivirgaceae bacterium]|jgi:methyl-accepting chemotaxis protein|nr:PAS domain S-box protein [Salinivirgaceae bacterium]